MRFLPKRLFLLVASVFVLMGNGSAADKVVYEGSEGPGKGKHILFIASDHEYRGEETCPAIARIMAKRYGFKCTVLFGQTEEGVIKPGSSIIPGIDAIDDSMEDVGYSETLSMLGIGTTATATAVAATMTAAQSRVELIARCFANLVGSV